MEEDELIEKADKIYYNWCKRNNVQYQIPNKSLSEVDDQNMIHLVNVNGEFATYQYVPKTDKIRRLK